MFKFSFFTLVYFFAVGAAHASSPVDFAYRNPLGDTSNLRRTVAIQGTREPGFRFDAACGSTGEQCDCLFYRNLQDHSPVKSEEIGLNSVANSLSCSIPNSVTDAQIRANYITRISVQRHNRRALFNSILIRTSLRLGDVLGPKLSKEMVRGIFRYSCMRTFFEGEGVTDSNITCVSGQHLGVIRARYSYYLYRSASDTSVPSQGTDTAFPSTICGRNDILKISCSDSTPQIRYGLYKEGVEPFTVAVTMSRAPVGNNLTATYGYAALPDTGGNCPIGLVKARPYTAAPASIVTGTIDPVAPSPPSSFINSAGSLNNTVVETATPANFIVSRRANSTPCAADSGDCTNASFAASTQAESVAYSGATPVVCVIPADLLNGIF